MADANMNCDLEFDNNTMMVILGGLIAKILPFSFCFEEQNTELLKN